ncbi:McrC family protein [Bacillus cereus]
MELFEYGKYEKLSDSTSIEKLKLYLTDVWDKRVGTPQKEDEESEELIGSKRFNQGFLKFDGQYIRAKNYVGLIKYEDETINIYPKIFKYKENHNFNFYFNNLLYWLSYSDKIHFPISEIELSNQDFDNILEVFIYIFATYTEKIIMQQPYQCYEEIVEETNYLKGRLAVHEYIAHNISNGNWQNFHCVYEPFIYDNKLNQVIKYTTSLLIKISNNTSNKEKLESILFILCDVSEKKCTYEDCLDIKLNRLFTEYEIIIEMCKLFLENQSISNSEFSSSNFCLLIPMEKIFEDFIYGFIKEHFNYYYSEITAQKSDLYLAKVAEDKDNTENVFLLRHDIYMRRKTEKNTDLNHMIIDMKYKILNGIDNKKGVAQEDLYQMVSYAIRRKCNFVHLIYPEIINHSNPISKNKFLIKDEFSHENGTIEINIHTVPITLNYEMYIKDGFLSSRVLDDTQKEIKRRLDEFLL